MAVKTRTVGDVTILDLSGKIAIGAGDAEIRKAVGEALDAGSTKLLLNMEGVTTIDSSGIGELVASYTGTTSRGGKLKLVNLPRKVQDILMITQLISIFETFDTESEAVDSFN